MRLCVYGGGLFSVIGFRLVPPPVGEPHNLTLMIPALNLPGPLRPFGLLKPHRCIGAFLAQRFGTRFRRKKEPGGYGKIQRRTQNTSIIPGFGVDSDDNSPVSCPSREWIALCRWMVESVLPNYWETISGIPPDSSTWSGGLGLGTLHVAGPGSSASEQVGGTAGTRRGKGVNFSVTRVVINYP
jgi:hypothetical protein